MEITIPEQLAALSHPKRLDLFRLLIRRYPSGVAAGKIAEALSLKPNTASSYLAALHKAGLIAQDRVATSLVYTADIDNIRAMFGGLLSECCQNRPDLCLSDVGALAHSPATGAAEAPMNVLFLCTGNSARSIIAEALLRDLGKHRFQSFSAGTKPKPTPHPLVLQVLQERGHDTVHLTSKPLDAFEIDSAPKMDLVITVCDAAANEECPIWPGQPIHTHWGLPDPVGDGQGTQAVNGAYNLIRQRVQALIALNLADMGPIALQHAVDSIGRIKGPSQ